MDAPGSLAYAAAITSSFSLSLLGVGAENAMFDCPEQSQTSPNRMSLMVRVVPPDVAVREVLAVDASCGLSDTRH